MRRERAVSVTFGYVLMLGIAMIMLVVVFTLVGGIVESQTARAVTEELTVIGHSLGGEIERADRLYRAGAHNASTLALQTQLPSHVSGMSYRVWVDGSAEEITLRTFRSDNSVTVPFNATTIAAENRSVPGGPMEIAMEAAGLVVRET